MRLCRSPKDAIKMHSVPIQPLRMGGKRLDHIQPLRMVIQMLYRMHFRVPTFPPDKSGADEQNWQFIPRGRTVAWDLGAQFFAPYALRPFPPIAPLGET